MLDKSRGGVKRISKFFRELFDAPVDDLDRVQWLLSAENRARLSGLRESTSGDIIDAINAGVREDRKKVADV